MFQRVTANIVFPQWLAGLAVTLLMAELSFMSGWTSPAIARLTAADSPILLNANEASWVASLLNLGRFFGSVIGAMTTNYLGSKKSMIATLVPIALSWLVILLAKVVELLYFARFLGGMGLGMAFSTFPLYLGEVSMPELRGALVSMGYCGGQTGMIIASVLGSSMSIGSSATLYLSSTLFLIMFYLWLPESPHHLSKIGDIEGARKSIDWYRSGKKVDEELKAVEEFVSSTGTETIADRLKEFRKSYVLRAMFHVITLFFFSQMCGLNSIAFYMETILIRAKSTIIRPASVVAWVMFASTFAAIVSLLLIDRFGRRMLLIASSIGVIFSMLLLTAHFILLDNYATNIECMPVIAMFLFGAMVCIGINTVPPTMLSELFPANVKCIASCIASLTGSSGAFISSKTYQPLVDLMGEAYVFLIYAGSGLVMIPYALLVMPETKGKTLLQIQDELKKNNRTRDKCAS